MRTFFTLFFAVSYGDLTGILRLSYGKICSMKGECCNFALTFA